MNTFIKYIFFGLFVSSMIADYGCNHPSYENLAEGKIVYKVSYSENYEGEALKENLQVEITMYFKDNKTCIEFISPDGNTNTRMISDSNAQTYSALVAVMGKKMAMQLGKEDVNRNYSDHVPLKISFTENTKQIAGVVCKEALCMDSTNNSYSVYYSDQFKIKDPNWTTCFNEIPGVLMEYQVQLNNHVMNLEAASISSERVDPALFCIPHDFKIISPPKNT